MPPITPPMMWHHPMSCAKELLLSSPGEPHALRPRNRTGVVPPHIWRLYSRCAACSVGVDRQGEPEFRVRLGWSCLPEGLGAFGFRPPRCSVAFRAVLCLLESLAHVPFQGSPVAAGHVRTAYRLAVRDVMMGAVARPLRRHAIARKAELEEKERKEREEAERKANEAAEEAARKAREAAEEQRRQRAAEEARAHLEKRRREERQALEKAEAPCGELRLRQSSSRRLRPIARGA